MFSKMMMILRMVSIQLISLTSRESRQAMKAEADFKDLVSIQLISLTSREGYYSNA